MKNIQYTYNMLYELVDQSIDWQKNILNQLVNTFRTDSILIFLKAKIINIPWFQLLKCEGSFLFLPTYYIFF